jgi:hypothetical protein
MCRTFALYYREFTIHLITYGVYICRVGQNHTFIGMYGVYTVFLARKSPYIRSYTVQIYVLANPIYMVLANPTHVSVYYMLCTAMYASASHCYSIC